MTPAILSQSTTMRVMMRVKVVKERRLQEQVDGGSKTRSAMGLLSMGSNRIG